MRRLLAAAWLLSGCVAAPPSQVDEVLGNFELVAEPVSSSCSYAEASSGALSFGLRVDRAFDGGAVTVTLGGVTRPATFDGQLLRTTYTAPRSFADCRCSAEQRDAGCACSGVSLDETLELVLLSPSQDEEVGRSCPQDALDGGVPLLSADGGALAPPATTPQGFNAVRACGAMRDDVVPGEGCFCPACAMRYAVRGVRR